MSLLISQAMAEAPKAAFQGAGGLDMIIILVLFGAIFYFLIFRPQSKRTKEHKNLMNSISKGDEVLTSGGILGKVAKVSQEDNFIKITISDELTVVIKKDCITAILPKGTLKSL